MCMYVCACDILGSSTFEMPRTQCDSLLVIHTGRNTCCADAHASASCVVCDSAAPFDLFFHTPRIRREPSQERLKYSEILSSSKENRKTAARGNNPGDRRVFP